MPELLALAPKQQLEKWHNLSLKYTEPYGAPELDIKNNLTQVIEGQNRNLTKLALFFTKTKHLTQEK